MGSATLVNFRKNLNQVKPSVVFLILSLLVGGYVRLSQALASTFPLNDGGLFYQMTQELMANHFRLPLVTAYNHLDIPYAYPPLAFYLTGLLNQVFGWSLLNIYRILPAVVTILTIPAFYLLAKDMIDDDNQLAIALLIFALSPVTFNWAIMGGGVTRSIAFLFALLALHFLFKLYVGKKSVALIWAAIFVSLSILTHPETGFHTAASVPVFWLFFSTNKKGALQTLMITLLTVLFTSPWWLTVVMRHGITPFTAAFLTAGQDGNAFVDLFSFSITDEFGIRSIALLGMIGLFLFIARKRYFIPALFLISYLVAPRSAKIFIAPMLAVAASYTLITLMNLMDRWRKGEKEGGGETPFASTTLTKLLLGLLFFQWFAAAISLLIPFSYIKMTKADETAMHWILTNSDQNDQFVVLTGYLWSSDPVSEWFPVLTSRTSVATVQGTEWLSGGKFLPAVKRARELQNCTNQAPVCLDGWADEYQLSYNYIYLRKLKLKDDKELVPYNSALAELLKLDPHYELIYETPEVDIFKKK